MPELPRSRFATERMARAVHALMSGDELPSRMDLNDRLQALIQAGRIFELADARMASDPKWEAQNLAYDALEAGSAAEAIRLVNEALRLDPACVDSQRLTVMLSPLPADDRIELMRGIVESYEELTGRDFFDENKGRFWGVIETRPYMRAMQDLAEAYAGVERFDDAIEVYERMLELSSNDNQGVRDDLLGIYLAAGRAEEADAPLKRSPGEERHLANPAWARVMERWLTEEPAEAGEALARAREVNLYVHGYLT